MMTEKQLLLARMAAHRARVLRDLIGVDEASFTQVRIYGDWNMAMLLAHLGEYDGFYAQAVLAALDGDLAAHGLDYTPIRDHLVPDRVGDWSLEESVDFMLRARANYVQTLAPVSEDDLRRKQRFNWTFGNKTGKSTKSIYTWTRERFLHDAGHHEDVREWMKKATRQDNAGPRSVMSAALQAASDDFWFSAALLDDAERDKRPVCGHWTLKDVVGHLADCDAYYSHAIGLLLDENPEPLELNDNEDQNEKWVKARARQSFERVKTDALSARQTLLDKLATLGEEELSFPFMGEGVHYPNTYHCFWSALEHYLDHAAVLRRELGVAMPKYLLRFKGPYTD